MDAGRAVVATSSSVQIKQSTTTPRRHSTAVTVPAALQHPFWGGERGRRWGGAGTRNPHISVRVSF